MKNIVTLFASVLLLAACSAPRYTYHFDHYDYNSGKKKAVANALPSIEPSPVVSENIESPLALQKEAVVASAAENPIVPEKRVAAVEKTALEKKYAEMTRTEKKAFRKTLKEEVKKYVKAKKSGADVKSGAATKAMDYNLKMAIIFGAVALTLSFFGGVNSVFWIVSVVALVVGVVFFIKWIAEQ